MNVWIAAGGRAERVVHDGPRVALLITSADDWHVLRHCATTLDDFAVAYTTRVVAPHDAPGELAAIVRSAESAGVAVFVAASAGAR